MWRWYLALAGPEALTYAEVEAYARMTTTPMLGWEADLLISLDRIYRNSARKRASRE